MAKYTFECDMGHKKVTFSAVAQSDEEALSQLIAKSRPHLAKAHSDMGAMSDDQIGGMIRGSWKKK